MIRIAPEDHGQRGQVLAVNIAAFGGEEEAGIVERLTQDELVSASLVALSETRVIGHILFSELPVDVDGKAKAVVALAPLAVEPAFQNQGVGTRLVEDGLAAMRKSGRAAVIVLGHPRYHKRFGFASEAVAHIVSPFTGNDAFMGLELIPGALKGSAGTCRYPAAFGL